VLSWISCWFTKVLLVGNIMVGVVGALFVAVSLTVKQLFSVFCWFPLVSLK